MMSTSISGEKFQAIKFMFRFNVGNILGGTNNGMIDAFFGTIRNDGENLSSDSLRTNGFDIALQVIPDENINVYVGGTTSGNLAANQLGEGDCFLTKFSSDGKRMWTNQFGTKNNDGVRGLAYNPAVSENIFVSGIFNLPPSKAFIRSYRNDGTLLWERCFKGHAEGDCSGKDISLDNKGFIYHLGLTNTNLFSTLNGGPDVSIVKLGLNK